MTTVIYCVMKPPEDLDLDPNDLMLFGVFILCLWMLSVLAFRFSVRKEYLATFTGDKPGRVFLRSNFSNAKTDEVRGEIFQYPFEYWTEER